MSTLPALPTVADILASAQASLSELQGLLTNFNPGGVTETTLEALALALGIDATSYPGVQQPGAYQLLQRAQQAAYILTAVGSDLDNKAADVNVFRKQPGTAQGGFQFSLPAPAVTATVFSVGTLVAAQQADPTVSPVLFVTTAAVTVPMGATNASTIAPIIAQVAGSSGNQPIGAVNVVVSGPYGATGFNPTATGGGSDLEGDDAPNGGLRARALAAIPNAAQCTVAAIEQDALSYSGVITALLLENLADDGVTFEPGRGQLLVDNGTGTLGSNTALISQIQTDFNSGLYRGASTQVHVVGATQTPVTSVSLSLTYDPTYANNIASIATTETAIATSIFAYINGLGIGNAVLIAAIIKLVMETPGVTDVTVSSVRVNGSNADFQPLFSQTARIASTSLVSILATAAF
jgi:uncharacterized phage protein gp47/JayE